MMMGDMAQQKRPHKMARCKRRDSKEATVAVVALAAAVAPMYWNQYLGKTIGPPFSIDAS
jgi:hypothetical protein